MQPQRDPLLEWAAELAAVAYYGLTVLQPVLIFYIAIRVTLG